MLEKDLKLGVHSRQIEIPGMPQKTFDRDHVSIPEVLIEDILLRLIYC